MESNFWNLTNLPQPATSAVQVNVNSPQILGISQFFLLFKCLYLLQS